MAFSPATRDPAAWHWRARLKARQLALLVALAEHGSMRKAASIIHVTQPAASKLLADLELALAVSLFERTSRGMTPTAYGETLVRYARGVLTDLREAGNEIAALKSGARGTLRIGAVTGAVPRLLAPSLAGLRRERPALRVFLLVNANEVLVAGLRQGTLDVAIGTLPAGDDGSGIERRSLATEPLCIAAGPDHPLVRRRRVLAAELGEASWVLHPVGSPIRSDADSWFADAGMNTPGNVVETVSIVATVALLRQADYVAFLPRDLARQYESVRLVVRLPIALPGSGTRYEVLTRSGRELSPQAGAFVELLKNNAGKGDRAPGRRASQR